MKLDKNQPQAANSSQAIQNEEEISNINPNTKNEVTKSESEDDPAKNEWYLREIYFSLKSDNPADW